MNRGNSLRRPDVAPLSREEAQWQDLRELLIGPEKRKLAQVLERLDDAVRRAEELSESLPDAITIGATRDQRISRALQPTIDEALKRSARKNPKAIADAIFPALGPAIRKAISAALMGMIQSLNLLLNQSFSFRGLKWRIESIRTRKSFAEVVLLHTLVFRVEQIFLIHRQSGILLQHVEAEHHVGKDPDLVSGMLTAIQEFVKDSFDSQTGEMLDTLRMDGDHSVWIEQGPQAVLAAVIRGIPPLELRDRFRELLDHVQRLYGAKLEDFQGQTKAFAMIRPDLEDALIYQVREHPMRLSPLLWLLLAAGITLGGWWSWHTFNAHRQWMAMLAQLRSQRGIVVTMAEKKGGRYFISGLKDPLAADVETIIGASRLDPQRIQTRWQPYYALDEMTVLQRTRLLLEPPSAVNLKIADGRLQVTGEASHRWVTQFRRRAGSIPGIQSVDDAGLRDIELQALRSAVVDLQRRTIFFKHGQFRIDQGQKEGLSAVLKILARIQELDRSMGISTRIAIVGQTDPSGRLAHNLQLSEKRAQVVMNYLIQNHIEPANLHPVGAPAPASAIESRQMAANDLFRNVTFNAWIGAE